MQTEYQESFWNTCLMSSEGKLVDYDVEKPTLVYNPREKMMRFGSRKGGVFKLLIGFHYHVEDGENSDFLCNRALRREKERAPNFLKENLLTMVERN